MSVVVQDRSRDPLSESGHSTTLRALLIEPRILRRVIRLDRHLAGLGLAVPHANCYVIERARLLAYADFEELELPLTAELPRDVVLIAKIGDEEVSRRSKLARYRQQLFHALVHLELQKKLSRVSVADDIARGKWERIGSVEHQEIHTVLLKDGLLFSESNPLETYIEFVAVYLELRYFAPEHLAAYFPAIRDWSAIDRLVSQDINHADIYQSSLREFADVSGRVSESSRESMSVTTVRRTSGAWRIRTRQLPTRARRASSVGNSVRAAILWTLETATGDGTLATSPPAAAVQEINQFVCRLQPALQLNNEQVSEWIDSLTPLLVPAASDI